MNVSLNVEYIVFTTFEGLVDTLFCICEQVNTVNNIKAGEATLDSQFAKNKVLYENSSIMFCLLLKY